MTHDQHRETGRTPRTSTRASPEQTLMAHRQHDAMIVRSAAEIGCVVLYSEDLNAGQEYSGIRVDNPFQPLDADPA